MLKITHLNCGWLHKPPLPPACCHCLLIESEGCRVLIDTGIGMHDVEDPDSRIGRNAIDAMGFQFHSSTTAVRQLEARGIVATNVGHIVLSHCDSDHVGGLSDFPAARVHLSAEEKRSVDSENPRYRPEQFSHGPDWREYRDNDCDFLGLPARRVDIASHIDVRLVPLFGHTEGHCGVAVSDGEAWLLYTGDAYYLRDELSNKSHPIDELATLAAVDNNLRVDTLNVLRRITKLHAADMTWHGYHDVTELPAGVERLADAT